MSRLRSTLIQCLAIGLVAAGVRMALHTPADATRTPAADTAPQTSSRSDNRFAITTATAGRRHGAPAATTDPSDKTADQTLPARNRHLASHATATTAGPVASVTPVRHEPDVPSPDAAVVELLDDPQAPEAPPIHAIQLAADVRLPAAMVPMVQQNQPPAVAAAAAEVGNHFYQNLLTSAANPPTPQEAPPVVNDTAMITNGPVTDHLRQAADELFRALYGNEKYIQQTLASAIEANLPPEPPVP